MWSMLTPSFSTLLRGLDRRTGTAQWTTTRLRRKNTEGRKICRFEPVRERDDFSRVESEMGFAHERHLCGGGGPQFRHGFAELGVHFDEPLLRGEIGRGERAAAGDFG